MLVVMRVAVTELGQYLIDLRGDESHYAVAKRINFRVTPTGIKNIEEGTSRRPKDTTLRILADAYAKPESLRDEIYRTLLRMAGYDAMEQPGVGTAAQTIAEQRVMERYRSLEPDAKQAVDSLLDVLDRRQRPEE